MITIIFKVYQPAILACFFLFLFILHLNLDNIPNILKSIITKISELSLGIYLVFVYF